MTASYKLVTPFYKLAGLDALRGVAILLVIIAHFGAGIIGSEASIVLGNTGVILFFFLSGCLMYWTLSTDSNITSYAVRRVFRILPMYWVSVLFVVILEDNWSWGQLLSNATFTSPIFGTERMLGVYWTLYIEALFYVIAPLIFFLGAGAIRFSTALALAGITAVAALRGMGTGAPFYSIFCLCGMQVGAWQRGKMIGYEVVASISIVSLLFVLLLPLPLYIGLTPPMCAALLLIALQPKIRLPPLEFLGAVSFSWYLLHSVFGYRELSFGISQQLSLLIGAVGTLALSAITYIFIERPAIALGKSVIRIRQSRK